jgi:hypothetical protein
VIFTVLPGRADAYKRLLKAHHENDHLQALLDLTALKLDPDLYRYAGYMHSVRDHCCCNLRSVILCLCSELDQRIQSNEAIAVTIEAFLMDYVTLSTKLLHLKSRLEGTQEHVRAQFYCIPFTHVDFACTAKNVVGTVAE